MNFLTVTFPRLGWSFDINPIVFSIGDNIQIHWYGVIIALGFALAVLYAMKTIGRFGLDSDRVIDVVMVSTIFGFIGARAYYVLFSWGDYAGDPLSVFYVWKGGLGIYGGIIGAFAAGFFMCRVRKISFFAMGDVAALGFLIGQGIGRWGNFVNGEAFGSNTSLPWGMSGTNVQAYLYAQQDTLASYGITVDPTVPVHPCFLYESLWCALGFLLLHLYRKHRKFDGEIMLMYIGWYGLGRFWIEGLRTDSLMLGQLRISQLVAALCVVASVLLIFIVRGRVKSAHDENYMPLYVNTQQSRDQLEDCRRRNTGTKEERAAYIKEADEKLRAERAEEKERRKAEKAVRKAEKTSRPKGNQGISEIGYETEKAPAAPDHSEDTADSVRQEAEQENMKKAAEESLSEEESSAPVTPEEKALEEKAAEDASGASGKPLSGREVSFDVEATEDSAECTVRDIIQGETEKNQKTTPPGQPEDK